MMKIEDVQITSEFMMTEINHNCHLLVISIGQKTCVAP